jgi:hypothetical protein
MKRYSALLASVLLLAATTQVWAGPASRATVELAEYAIQRFGRQAVREGAEAFAVKIESAAAKHGDEVFMAVRKVGPRALPLVEEAGAQGKQAARVLAQHGEAGAVNVVSRPVAMRLVARHGEEAAAVLVKHAGIAEPVIEGFGAPAMRALAATGPQAGRRVAMLMADGDLAKIGRTPEVLEVIAKFGDRAAAFVWSNKGALAVGATLTAFLARPEAFISGAEKLAGTVAENAIRPLAEVPGKVVDKTAEKVADGVAKGTNWTVVILAILGGVGLLLAVKLGWIRQRPPAQPAVSSPPQALPIAVPAPNGTGSPPADRRNVHA